MGEGYKFLVHNKQGVQHIMVLVVNFFQNFEIRFFGFVVAIYDLEQCTMWLRLTANSMCKSILKNE